MSATSGEAKSTRANGTSSSHQLPAGSKEAERRHPLNDTREVSVDAEDMDMIEPDSDKDAAASSARTISTTKKHRGLRRSRVCPGTDSENSAPLLKAAPYRQLTISLPFEECRQTRYLLPRKGLPRAQPIWLVVKQPFTLLYDCARKTALTSRNIRSGWSKACLWPFNSEKVLGMSKPLEVQLLRVLSSTVSVYA